jgi:hypothetical protein
MCVSSQISERVIGEGKLQKRRNQINSKKIRKNKTYNNEEKPYLKKMRCVFFLQTSNLHPDKQKYKSEKETLYFYYNYNNNNKKHIKIEKIKVFKKN